MKKLILLFIAIVGLQFANASEPIDVTEQYLGNTTKPFENTGESVLNDSERWQRLALPWIYENEAPAEEGSTGFTTWHTDANKGNTLTITPGWDGFSNTFENVKVYQTTTLPAGQYELALVTEYGQDWKGDERAYVVINAGGTGIPDVEDLASAIAYGQFKDANANEGNMSVVFKLDEETEVSIGFVMSSSGTNGCYAMHSIHLYTFEGVSYKALQAVIDNAKKMTESQYPTGTIAGTYSIEKWDALQAAIAYAEEYIEEDKAEEQDDVDVVIDSLKTAMNELTASLVLPFRVSDDSQEIWYQLRDNRATKNYWLFGEIQLLDEETEELYEYPLALVVVGEDEADSEDDMQLFKIVKAEAPSLGYYIYNKAIEGLPLHVDEDSNVVVFDEGGVGTTWLFSRGVDGSHYIIATEDGGRQLNSFATYDPPRVGLYNNVNDAGNNWEFVQLVEGDDVDFAELLPLVSVALGMGADKYPIGMLPGEYPQENWDIFVNIRAQAVGLAERAYTDNEPSQQEVDEMVVLLQEAIDQLNESEIPPVKLSTNEEEFWYVIYDKRAAHNHWKLGRSDEFVEEDELNDESEYENQILLRGGVEVITTNMLFKFVKPEDSSLKGYEIYNKLMPELPIVTRTKINDENEEVVDGEWIGVDEFAVDAPTWLLTATGEDYYLISIEKEPGVSGNQLNSHMRSPAFPGFYNGGAGDPGNNWRFVLSTETSTKEVKANELNIHVLNRTIVSTNPTDKLEVYSINGQRMNAKQQLPQGVYVVRIEGKAGAAKVVVR